MKTINTKELKQKLDKDADLTVVNVLGQESYAKKHIPGSVNLPFDDDFEKRVQKKFPNKDATLVVHCANTECSASPKAAKKLQKLGYKNVYDYEGGIEAWKKAGHKLKGKMVKTPAS